MIGPGDYNKHTRLKQITDERELIRFKDPGCADCGSIGWKPRGYGRFTLPLCEYCANKKGIRNTTMMLSVLDDINDELGRQYQKFGDQFDKSSYEWCAVLGEEYGEVCQALLQDRPNLETELIQTAAVCVKWLENMRHLRDRKETK